MSEFYECYLSGIHGIYLLESINVQNAFLLQKAIYLTFNEWLDKRKTLTDWVSGVDTEPSILKNRHNRMIENKKTIRQLMTAYCEPSIQHRRRQRYTKTCPMMKSDDESAFYPSPLIDN